MKTFGDLLELFGTVTTAIGLVIAWEKATGRLNSLRDSARKHLVSIRQKLGLGGDAIVQATVAAAFASAGQAKVRVVGQHRVDPDVSLHQQVEGVASETRILREMIADLREYIEKVEAAPQLELADVNAALDVAISELKSELNVSSAKDFRVAIGGVFVTTTGMLLGLVPETWLSWIPWI
ncbi:hypothetical protein ACFWBG_23180 [Nocardia salmonicida]|uniref:hypothetical protein n=1 Tax=Nocardia salmonicida TaxID=53431 RepID=UPI00366D2E6F